MKREYNAAAHRLAWDRLWRILLAPMTEEELARASASIADTVDQIPGDLL